MLDAYPDAIKAKDDDDGWLPLHLAAHNNKSEAVVKLVLDAYPDAIKAKNDTGNLPLHWAADNNESEAVVKLCSTRIQM